MVLIASVMNIMTNSEDLGKTNSEDLDKTSQNKLCSVVSDQSLQCAMFVASDLSPHCGVFLYVCSGSTVFAKNTYYCIKKQCRTLLTAAVNAWLRNFQYDRTGATDMCTGPPQNEHNSWKLRSRDIGEKAKNSARNNAKCSKCFQFLCNNSDRAWFFNALTFARSLGRCWKPRPPASVFNTSHGTCLVLMHEKPCLIPI